MTLVYKTLRGGRFHLFPDCPGIADGHAKAASEGFPNHPVAPVELLDVDAEVTACTRCWGAAFQADRWLASHLKAELVADSPYGWTSTTVFSAASRGVTPTTSGCSTKPSAIRVSPTESTSPSFARGGSRSRSRSTGFQKDKSRNEADEARQTAASKRENDLTSVGWVVLRFTNRDVSTTPSQCRADIENTLGRPTTEAAKLASRHGTYDRLPKVHRDESRTQGLDRLELIRFLQVAQTITVHHGALAYLLGINALRASEAAAVRIEDYAETPARPPGAASGRQGQQARHHAPDRTGDAGPGGLPRRAPPGPLILRPLSGRPIDRRDVYRMVARIAKAAGIPRHISPHSLRHAAITNALDAGVPLRDAQILARHADPRTTEHYDRARGNLDRHGVHFLTAYVAGVYDLPQLASTPPT